MNINELIAIVKNKLEEKIIIQDIVIEDKSYLHKNHAGNQEGKFHLKLVIRSNELMKLNRVSSTKKIYSILDTELKEHIHSIQILLS
ncbi:BolA family transcriptional regulator [Candidatus Pelagibacter sp.]|jgi:BolA family transcriptional regulator, general stress-responsive regulator|nr:BolA family transcriptional regulator [Candidatus Pelagibacter sp.]